MSINRITGPSSTPLTVPDYQAQNALIAGLGNGFGTLPWSGANMTVGAVFQVGGTIYRVDTATAISGTASDYVVITPSGDGSTATASFVANLSGVTWSSVYNGYYSGSNRVLIAYHYGQRKSVYTGAGSFAVPPGVGFVTVSGVGIGGNGGAGENNSGGRGGGGGGSGGSVYNYICPVTTGGIYTISWTPITITPISPATLNGSATPIVIGSGGNGGIVTGGSAGVVTGVPSGFYSNGVTGGAGGAVAGAGSKPSTPTFGPGAGGGGGGGRASAGTTGAGGAGGDGIVQTIIHRVIEFGPNGGAGVTVTNGNPGASGFSSSGASGGSGGGVANSVNGGDGGSCGATNYGTGGGGGGGDSAGTATGVGAGGTGGTGILILEYS